MDDEAAMEPVAGRIWSLVLPPQSWFLPEDITDSLFKLMAIALILGLQPVHRTS